MASAGAGRGYGSPGGMRPTITQQQAQELLRKQRKCVDCGNTASGKCEFRCCGTCCVRRSNPCQVHGLKQGVNSVNTARPADPSVRPHYQWPPAAVPGMGMPPQYMPRPMAPGPTPYGNPAAMNPPPVYRVAPYGQQQAVKMQTPPAPETEAQKEARLEKARKASLLEQREALMANHWRILKMKAYQDAERCFEDEAFDRYMRTATLLEEIVGSDEELDVEPIASQKDGRLLEAVLTRHDSKHRELQRQKLQKSITKSFQKLRKKEGDSETMLEIREFGFGRRDTKRMKVQTLDGKERLRCINAWEDIFQGIGSMTSIADVSLLLDSYKENFRHDLGYSLPHLIRKEKVPDAEQRMGIQQKQAIQKLVDTKDVQQMDKKGLEEKAVDAQKIVEEQRAVEQMEVDKLDVISGQQTTDERSIEGTKPMATTKQQEGAENPGEVTQQLQEADGEEERMKNAPRLPVRRLVTNLIKQKPVRGGVLCCKVELDEQSLDRVYKNHQRYSLESL